MSGSSSDTNSPYECLSDIDPDQPNPVTTHLVTSKMSPSAATVMNKDPVNVASAVESGNQSESQPQQPVPQQHESSNSPSPSSPLPSSPDQSVLSTDGDVTANVPSKEVTSEEQPDQPPKSPTGSTSGSDSGQGSLFGWIANNGFLNRVAEKAKNSVDTVITTLDPGMKEFLYSGGGVNVVIASDKEEAKVGPMREAFIDIFGRATVKGVPAQCSTVAAQPVGFEAAIQSANERISFIRTNLQYDVPQNQTILSVEGFLVELTPGSWYDMGCLLLDDPLTGTQLVTYTQPTPIPYEAINFLSFETPKDYDRRTTGFSKTIGHFMTEKLNVPHDSWHESVVGISRKSMLYMAACGLARIYKDKLNR